MNVNLAPRMFESAPIRRCKFPSCKAACCLHGVWLDKIEVDDLIAHAAEISPFMPSGSDQPDQWFEGTSEIDPHSTTKKVIHSVVIDDRAHYGGTACVFLREDFKCALQVAAEAMGEHPWRFKPFYCILHPLDLDENGCITLDEDTLLISEPASCLQKADAPIPLLVTFEPELRYLLGNKVYDRLIKKSLL